ncbi:MAG: flavin reductase family protein, partial [Gemmatimonadota bacterium]
ESGRYVMHLLARDQWDVIRDLGFESGRERDKLSGLDHRPSDPCGIPVIDGCVAWMRCEVANVMDAGASTFFMGDVLEVGRGGGEEVMDGAYFRANVPDEWEEPYRRNLRETQERARRREDQIDDRPWRRLRRNPDGGAGS